MIWENFQEKMLFSCGKMFEKQKIWEDILVGKKISRLNKTFMCKTKTNCVRGNSFFHVWQPFFLFQDLFSQKLQDFFTWETNRFFFSWFSISPRHKKCFHEKRSFSCVKLSRVSLKTSNFLFCPFFSLFEVDRWLKCSVFHSVFCLSVRVTGCCSFSFP